MISGAQGTWATVAVACALVVLVVVRAELVHLGDPAAAGTLDTLVTLFAGILMGAHVLTPAAPGSAVTGVATLPPARPAPPPIGNRP